VVLGNRSEAVAAEVASRKLDAVHTVEDEKIAEYTPGGYVPALKQVNREARSASGDIEPYISGSRLCSKAGCGARKNICNRLRGFRVEGNDVVFTRQIFQGKINTDVRVTGAPPILASFQAGSYRADKAEAGEAPAPIAPLEINLADVQIRSQVEPKFQEAKQAVDLSQAPLIVAVGRGIKSQENIEMVQKLADAMGAELAASRPICDNEWLPMDRQIGSSGQTVFAKLYMAIGISGAIQHVVGMKNSQTIVAINKDAEAPIFDIADYGIVA